MRKYTNSTYQCRGHKSKHFTAWLPFHILPRHGETGRNNAQAQNKSLNVLHNVILRVVIQNTAWEIFEVLANVRKKSSQQVYSRRSVIYKVKPMNHIYFISYIIIFVFAELFWPCSYQQQNYVHIYLHVCGLSMCKSRRVAIYNPPLLAYFFT